MTHSVFSDILQNGKVMKENHIRKVRKSEERKVKNIGEKKYFGEL